MPERLEFFGNFFNKYYLLDHEALGLDEQDRNKALGYSIIFGLFTLGLVHLGCAIARIIEKKRVKVGSSDEVVDAKVGNVAEEQAVRKPAASQNDDEQQESKSNTLPSNPEIKPDESDVKETLPRVELSSPDNNHNHPVMSEEFVNQQLLVTEWLMQFKEDYVAHAIWNKNLPSVIEKKAVLPAEALLREKGKVEYEKGARFGERGESSLVDLSYEEIEEIAQLNLENYEKDYISQLEDLFAQSNFSNGEEYFSQCTKEVKTYLDNYRAHLESATYWLRSKNHVLKEQSLLTEEEKKRLNGKPEIRLEDTEEMEILLKVKFRLDAVKYHRARLKYYKRKRDEGINFGLPINLRTPYYQKHYDYIQEDGENRFFTPHTDKSAKYISDKALSKNTSEYYVKIAYDKFKGNPTDNYFNKKYRKWIKREPEKKFLFIDLLYDARRNYFGYNKLVPEVRATKNSVNWGYGDVALCRGNGKEIIVGNPRLERAQPGEEVLLLSPWMNGGEFFSLPLAQEETIIIGKKEILEPFADKLEEMGARYVYFENLTEEQKTFFSIQAP